MALVSPVSADILSAEIENVVRLPKHAEAIFSALSNLRHSLTSLHTALSFLWVELHDDLCDHDKKLKILRQEAEPLRRQIAAIKPRPSEPDCVLEYLLMKTILYRELDKRGFRGKELGEREQEELYNATQEKLNMASHRGNDSLTEFERQS